MAHPPFALLYDYRCPFARNVHEHVVAAMETGLDLDVTFVPYTLDQGHVEDGSPAVWDDPAYDDRLLALEISVAVRDNFPEKFLDLHAALFEARHAKGIALTTREQLTAIMEARDIDADAVYDLVATGAPRRVIADAWIHYHDDLDVFGVPTFVLDDADATFIRLMHGPDQEDRAKSQAVISQLLDLIALQPEINELKHTRLAR